MPNPAVPTNLKVLHGNPGRRPLPENEPKPEIKIPRKSKYLNTLAKKEWNRIAPELEKLGLLSEIDHAALEAYCQSYARWQNAEGMLKKHGEIIKAPSGYPIQSPYLSIANKSLEFMHKFLVEFGMTPSSRTRIQVKPKSKTDESEDFLFGNN